MKQFFLIFKVLISNWMQAKSHLLFTLLGIAIACSLWSSVDAINNQTIRAQNQALKLFSKANKPIIVKKNSSLIDESSYVELRLNGWMVSPVIQKRLSKTGLEVIGLDFLSEYKQLFERIGTKININHFSQISNDTPTFFASKKTEKIIRQKNLPVKIVINDRIPDKKMIGDIFSAQKFLKLRGKFSYLEINGSMLRTRNNLHSNNLLIIDNSTAKEFQSISNSFSLNLKAFGFLSFCVGMFIVFTTIKMAFNQRIGCIRSLKIIGVSDETLNFCLIIELLIIAIIAGSFGTITGFFFAKHLLPGVNQTLTTLYDSPTKENLGFSLDWFFLSILIAMLGTLFASLTSLTKLRKVAPINTGKTSHENPLESVLRVSIIFLPIITGCLYFVARDTNNLIFSFASLAFTILLGCVLLPYFMLFIYYILKKFVSVNTPLYNWFLKDTNKYAKLIFSGYLAFFLALSINIGVHGMVMSFKSTFTHWLDKRIFADTYIQITNEENLGAIKRLAGKYQAEIYPIVKEKALMDTETLEVYGFRPSKIYEKNWPILKKSKLTWENIKKEDFVFINEQLSREKKLKVGDTFYFWVNKKKIEKKISAVYSDYGNSKNQIMMSMKAFNGIFPSKIPNTLAIKLDDTIFSLFMNEILNSKNISYGTIISKKEVKEMSIAIFDNTFKISFQLALVTLIVAGFTLYTNLTTVKKLRERDFLPLNAIGIRMLDLLKFEVLKNMALTLLVSVFSIFMGVLISYILSSLVNPNAFGWEVPLIIFPDYWLKITIVALIISLISSCLSLRLIYKNNELNVKASYR